MRFNSRTVVVTLLACISSLACRDTTKRSDFDGLGRNPAPLITSRGEAHVVYVDPTTRGLLHRRLDDSRSTPISPAGDAIDLRGENAPLFTSRSDGSLLVIYPAVLPGGSGHHHTKSELRAQVSRDGGRAWSPPRRIDGDGVARSHNFADFAVAANGDVVVSWLDSRAGQQGVQTTVVQPDLAVLPAQTADVKTCQCCRTALFTASDGELWLAYRDLAEGNIRNVAYAVASGAGQPFVRRGDVVDDRWSVNGCPESGPRFAETSDGAIWLAWFNGAANSIETAAAPPGSQFVRRGAIVGSNHPDIGTLPDGRLIVVYEAQQNGKRAIQARISDADHARWSGAVTLGDDGISPRYVRRGDRALLSYTTYVGSAPHVRVVDPLPRIPSQ